MTYDEAVVTVASQLECNIEDCSACQRQAKGILDAIGYREMIRAGNLLGKDASLLLGSYQVAVHERDEARALVDRLVEAIFPDSNDESADIAEREEALAAYEDRSWR